MELAIAPFEEDDDLTQSVADPLREVLGRLGDRIAPIALARERTMPVCEPLRPLFPEGGLVRGRVTSCRGGAASTLALSLVRDALVEGAWMAAIDIDTFGADAANELGVPLERVVRVTTSAGEARVEGDRPDPGADWIDVMGAAVDGFDIVVTRVPASLRSAAVRKLVTRFQQRGAVVVVLGESGAVGSDVTLTTARSVWSGIGQGTGRLRRRRIDVEATGRRLPGMRSCSLDLAATTNRIELVTSPRPVTAVDPQKAVDPQEQVLAEMARSIPTIHDIGNDLTHRTMHGVADRAG